MSADLALYITRYGYLAIFLFVLLQELGVPNPVTNEFVLLFSGYLAYSGALNLWLVFLTAVSADCIGTTILYAVFYLSGEYIMVHRPRWLPVSQAHIDRIANTITERRQWGIYVGRLIPFLRGYVSVAAGILRIRPKIFIPAVVISAITWSGGYVIAGKLLGPYWQQAAAKTGFVESLILAATLIAIATAIGRAFIRRHPKIVGAASDRRASCDSARRNGGGATWQRSRGAGGRLPPAHPAGARSQAAPGSHSKST